MGGFTWTAPNFCFTGTSTGAARVSVTPVGISRPTQHQFQNIPSLCFHLKRSPIPALVRTNLPVLSCLPCPLTLPGLCVKVYIELDVRKVPSYGGGGKTLLYPVSLGSKLTRQKMYWQKRTITSLLEISAKRAWKTWHSAQSCQLCLNSKVNPGCLRNSLSQGGGHQSLQPSPRTFFSFFERVSHSLGWPQTP